MAPSILLVDNDADSIAIYSLILRHHGYEVIAADDPATALRIALERHPDVVISEVFLPAMEGGALYDQLRANERTARIPMILLDSIASWGGEPSSVPVPATRLTKPCEPSKLLLEVERLLEARVTTS